MRDVAVAPDDYNLDRGHDNKVLKYDTQDIHAWMLRSVPVDTQRLAANVGATIYMQLERTDSPKII